MTPSFDDGNFLFNSVVQDSNGVKGMVDEGLSAVPKRYIQSPKERIDEKNVRICAQAPIDLSKLDGTDHDRVAKEIGRAAETLGFFQVVSHGMHVELLESLNDSARTFFTQPPEKKAVYRKGASPSPLVKYGTSFVPEKEKVLEWKDYISVVYTNDAEDVALEYLKRSMTTVKNLLETLIGNLGVKPEDSKIDKLIGFKMVNMNFNPACPNPDLTVGVGRHSDMGTLTALLQDGLGVLYVKVEEDIVGVGKQGEWREIPPIPGALVIKVGDTLQILSNGRYTSVEHRVRTTSTQSRVSIPIFTIPRTTEKIGPLPHLVDKEGTCFESLCSKIT